jgi:hypothetical protein
MSDFKAVQPLFYIDKDGKTPIYYGIGAFFNKRPAVLLRLAHDKDQFTLPLTLSDKKQARIAALAQLMSKKLVLGRFGVAVWNNPEHTYLPTLKILVEKAKVDTKAQADSREKSSVSDLDAALSLLDKIQSR